MTDSKIEEETSPQEMDSKDSQNASSTSNSDVLSSKYPLEDKWLFYFDTGFKGAKNLSECIMKSVLRDAPINTLLQFWTVWEKIQPHKLPVYSNLRFFKRDIAPLVDDDRLSNGCRWMYTFTNVRKRENYWTEVLMALVGNNTYTKEEDVVGVVFMTRAKFDAIQIFIGSNNTNEDLIQSVHDKTFAVISRVHPNKGSGQLYCRKIVHKNSKKASPVVGATPVTPSGMGNRSPITPTTPRKDHYKSQMQIQKKTTPQTPPSPTSYLSSLQVNKQTNVREPIRRRKTHQIKSSKPSPLTVNTTKPRKFHSDDIELIPIEHRSVGTPTSTRQSQPEVHLNRTDVIEPI